MKIWHILCFGSLTVLSVFLLAAGWEFGIEEIVESRLGFGHEKESLNESWEQVVMATILAGMALIVPVLMALKIGAQRQEAQREIAHTAHILKTTFDNMSRGIAVHDADLNLIAFNQQYVDLLDYPPGFIRLGMGFEEIARFNPERGDYGDGDPEELVRERLALRNQMKPDRNEITTARGLILSKRREPLPGGGYVTTFTNITKRKRAEEALRESRERLAGILDIADDAVISIDEAHRIILFNKGAERTFGYGAEEVLGEPIEMLIPSHAREDHRRHVKEFAEGSSVARKMGERREVAGRRKDGTEFPGEASISKLNLNGKRIFTVILRDVTARKAAEREIADKSALLETTFQSMTQGISVFDADLNLIAFNQKYLDLWDFPPGVIRLGMPCEEIVRFRAERGDYGPGDVEEHVRERGEAKERCESISKELTIANGTVIALHADPMPGGGYVSTHTDVTMRKQAEEALRESEEHMQQHVIELEAAKRQYEAQGVELVGLAEELAVARDQAEGANRAKSDFLALMSHELRTPLNAIIGFSEIIKSEMMGPIGNPKYGEYASDVFDSGQHLLGLINDILDLSKIEAGKMEFDEDDVDVAEVIGSCLRLVTERAAKGGVKLITEVPDDLPALLRIDARKLKQILLNLLSNAVKFTPAGGSVTIRSWFRPDSGFVLQVADTGVGIALEDIPKALTPFGQVDSRLDRKYEGTGLGLPLTKSLIEKHGGSFDLQSEVGVGTTVTVRFPKERAVAMPADAPSAPQTLSTA
ncbi:MAG: PAS-domain containing protein [Proteobacteria bacterium]|nr:PAS-domain containing protein [Pseudomonadota bacterium]